MVFFTIVAWIIFTVSIIVMLCAVIDLIPLRIFPRLFSSDFFNWMRRTQLIEVPTSPWLRLAQSFFCFMLLGNYLGIFCGK
jgi:hypothetical protein